MSEKIDASDDITRLEVDKTLTGMTDTIHSAAVNVTL